MMGFLKTDVSDLFLRILICNIDGSSTYAASSHMSRCRSSLTMCITAAKKQHSDDLLCGRNTSGTSEQVELVFRHVNWIVGRRFCRTAEDRLGWLPYYAREGDVVCVLYGGEMPYVLRPGANGCYRLIGECYMHGIMDGEALDIAGIEDQWFRLR